MEKQIVKLDKIEISKAIELGDNCSGNRVLSVSPTGDYRIVWMETQRAWDPWGDDDIIIGIPALDPDGSGQESEDAEDMLKAIGLYDEAKALKEDDYDLGWVDLAEKMAPDDWKANREESLYWLAEAFLATCNGDGSDLNDPDPWRGQEVPFEFDWK